MSYNDDTFGMGIRRCNVETVPCRTCRNAYKAGIGKATCLAYGDIEKNPKPDAVYFDNEPCKDYVAGEDLLPYEITFDAK